VFGLLLTLIACQTSAPTIDPVSPDPDAHLSALKEGIDASLLMWQGAQPRQAQVLLEQTYREHFEPFEPAMQEQGINTLQLEYDFGRIGWRMRRAPSTRRADSEELSGLVLLLSHDVEAAFAALPATSLLQPPR
jgi:hypothetical protein